MVAKKMKERKDLGLTFLKMDFGVGLLAKHPGTVINGPYTDYTKQWGNPPTTKGNARSYANTKHPFTGIQITDKGIKMLLKEITECNIETLFLAENGFPVTPFKHIKSFLGGVSNGD